MRRAVHLAVPLCMATSTVLQAQVTPGPPQSTSADLSVQESWDSNPRLTVGNGQGSYVNRVSADLAHVWNEPRLQLSIMGQGYGQFYSKITGFDRFNYTGDLNGSFLLSPRTTLTVRESYASSYYQSVPNTPTVGLPLALVLVNTNVSTASLTYKMSQHTTVNPHLRYFNVKFDTQGLSGGSMAVGGVDLRHAVGSSDGLLFLYDYQWSESVGVHRNSNTVAAGWDHGIATGWSLSALGGASRYQGGGGVALTLPYADAGITNHFRRGSFSVKYQHQVSQAFGLARDRVGDLVVGDLSWSPTRKFNVVGFASYGTNHDPLDTAFRFQTQNEQVSLRQELVRRLFLGGYYRYSWWRQTGLPSAKSTATGLALTWGTKWP